MASYLKRKNTWHAQVVLMGKRLTASFDTKSQAIAWATEKEAAIRAEGCND